MLNPPSITDQAAQRFIGRAFGADHQTRLRAVSPVIEYERECLDLALNGDPDPICQLIEHASIVALNGTAAGSDLRNVQYKVAALLSEIEGQHTVIVRHFGGLYFSYMQAAALDSILVEASAQAEDLRDTYLAAAISTASEIVNTVGKHFAQPVRPRGSDGKPKRHLTAKIVRDRAMDIPSLFTNWLDRYRSLPHTGRKHRAIRADFTDALETAGNEIGVIYADPPYTRDHYSRFYHVLETMCLRDDPGVSTTRIRSETETFSRGMYRANRHQSPFCIKSKAPGAFERLFAAARDLRVPVVLSYSPYAMDRNAHPRVMTIEHIESLARKYFERVDVKTAGRFSHTKLNTTRLHIDASDEAELILLCT